MQISEKLLDLIVDLHDEDDFQVRVDYSGRGMFGEECLGIVGSNASKIIYKIMNAIIDNYSDSEGEQLELFKELTKILSYGYEQDSMGLNIIVYFPDVEIDEEKKEEILDRLVF